MSYRASTLQVQLSPYLASCLLCRDRWERARSLHVRSISRPDEDSNAEIAYAGMLTPFGIMWLGAGPCGLARVEFNLDELAFRRDLEREGLGARYAPSELDGPMEQFAEFFAGRPIEFNLPLDLTHVSPFRKAVLGAVSEIPWGHVRSYGEIAGIIGRPGAARAVGSAMATNPLSIVVPCHRVIRGDGMPGEYGYRSLGACGNALKRALLAMEGVMFDTLESHGVVTNAS